MLCADMIHFPPADGCNEAPQSIRFLLDSVIDFRLQLPPFTPLIHRMMIWRRLRGMETEWERCKARSCEADGHIIVSLEFMYRRRCRFGKI
jgi:hypothetical protein